MSSVKIAIRFVGGSLEERRESPEVLAGLQALEAQGLTDKALIDALLTDAWRPPPAHVNLT